MSASQDSLAGSTCAPGPPGVAGKLICFRIECRSMGGHAALALIMLLSASAFASQAPLEKFLNGSFEPGQRVETTLLAADGSFISPASGPFYLVAADGVETYVLDAPSGKTVESPYLSALLEYDAINSTGYQQKLDRALAFPGEAAAAKNEAERKCMQYTGTDMHPCFDKQSCTIACFAVPLCSTPLYSDGFWEAMLDWTKSRENFTSLLADYENGLAGVGTYGSVLDYKSGLLDSLSATAQNISKNPLFLNRTDEGCAGGGTVRCFEFCPKIDYSSARIAAQKQNLAQLKQAMAAVSGQKARAEAIEKAGQKNDEYLSSRGRDYQELRLYMLNTEKRLQARGIYLSKNVTDPELAPLLESLSGISSSIQAKADSGRYRAALAGRKEFEAKEAETEGRMDSDEKAHSDMLFAVQKTSGRLDKAEGIIGKESAGQYREDLAAISETLFAAPTFGEIGAARGKLDTINTVLTAEIAAKAVGEEPQEPQSATQPQENATQAGKQENKYPQPPQLPKLPSSFPCAPGLVALALLGFAFSRRSNHDLL